MQCKLLLLVLIILTTGQSSHAFAQSSSVKEKPAEKAVEKHGWDGVIGIGPVLFPKYTGGSQMEAPPLPILSINYEETFFVEIQRVGVYVLASDDKKNGTGIRRRTEAWLDIEKWHTPGRNVIAQEQR